MKLWALVGMALALAACGGGAETLDDGGTSTGCPLEAAPGVLRAVVVDGGCTYQCTQTRGQAPRYLCPADNACRVQDTAQNCDYCGHTCGSDRPYCVADLNGHHCSTTP